MASISVTELLPLDGFENVIEGPRNGDGPAGDDENGGVAHLVAIGQNLDGPEPDEIAPASIINEQQEASGSIAPDHGQGVAGMYLDLKLDVEPVLGLPELGHFSGRE